MKSLLKFMLLLALVVGGRLTRTTQPVAAAPQGKALDTAQVVLVNQREDAQPTPSRPEKQEPSRAQVLSVFFK